MFKKKKNLILFNNPNIELNIGVTIIPELKPYIPILKDTIFSNKTNAEDIVMSSTDMVNYFRSNLPTLMSKNLSLFNNLPQEKSIELLGEVARSLSIVIKIPKYIQNKHFPEEVLINKDFLKDNFKKAQVIEFYKSNLKQASNMKITDDLRYYKYILEILECDFSEY
jgi:5-bromo-4-chloroindolyl phosphate hydrolysis protein